MWVVSVPVGLTLEPQWSRIHPLPFTDPADKFEDLALNILLFVPFGYLFAMWRRNVRLLLVAAAGTSLSAEAMQLFSTVRYPSGTDVVYALAGAVAGALLSLAISKVRA